MLWVGLFIDEGPLVIVSWVELTNKVELMIFWGKRLELLLASGMESGWIYTSVSCEICGIYLARYLWLLSHILMLIDLNFVEWWLMLGLCWWGLVCRMLCLLHIHRAIWLDMIVLLHRLLMLL